MFNVGGGELLVILLVAMIVIGPAKLPAAARQVGGFLTHIRELSNDFKRELEDAIPEEVTELTREIDKTRQTLRVSLSDNAIERKAREKGKELLEADKKSSSRAGGNETDPDSAEAKNKPQTPALSTAAAAGMFPDESESTAAVSAEEFSEDGSPAQISSAAPAAVPEPDQESDDSGT